MVFLQCLQRTKSLLIRLVRLVPSHEDCKYHHDPSVCRCDRLALNIGQDESCYFAFAMSKKEWRINGHIHMRKKTEGIGVMVSLVVELERI